MTMIHDRLGVGHRVELPGVDGEEAEASSMSIRP